MEDLTFYDLFVVFEEKIKNTLMLKSKISKECADKFLFEIDEFQAYINCISRLEYVKGNNIFNI